MSVPWDKNVMFWPGDIVTYQGKEWKSIKKSQSQVPVDSDSAWQNLTKYKEEQSAKAVSSVSVPAASSAGAERPSGLMQMSKEESGKHFLTRYYAGVPGWGWLVGGGIAATGLILLIRAAVKK